MTGNGRLAAYITLYAGDRPAAHAAYVLATKHAPGVLRHAVIASHLGRPVLRVREPDNASFREHYTGTLNALRAIGATFRPDLNGAAGRALAEALYPKGLLFSRRTDPASNSRGTITTWSARLDGVLIGEWRAAGGGWVATAAPRVRLIPNVPWLAPWRVAVKDEAARRLAAEYGPTFARASGLDPVATERTLRDVMRGLLG